MKQFDDDITRELISAEPTWSSSDIAIVGAQLADGRVVPAGELTPEQWQQLRDRIWPIEIEFRGASDV